MSGHNKWSQIKHQKGAKDAKRGVLFTKILGAIAIAAKQNPKPEENPRLRTLVVTDNSNRSMQHLRLLASEIGCKPADQGSTLWAFELVDELIDGVPTRHYKAKFPQACSAETAGALSLIIEKLEEHEDIQRVATNAPTETAD